MKSLYTFIRYTIMTRFEIYEKEGEDFPPLTRAGIDLIELAKRKEIYRTKMIEAFRDRLGLREEDEVILVVDWVN